MSILNRKFVIQTIPQAGRGMQDEAERWCVIQSLSKESEMMSGLHAAILTEPWDTAGRYPVRRFVVHIALFGANYLAVADSPPPATIPNGTKIPVFTRPEPLFVFNRWSPLYYNSTPHLDVEIRGPVDQMAQNPLYLTINLSTPATSYFPGPDYYFTMPVSLILEGYDDARRRYVASSEPVEFTSPVFIFQEQYITNDETNWTSFILGFSVPGKSIGPIWTHAVWFRMPINNTFGTISRATLTDALTFVIN